jgi:hypothetical protein
VSQFRIRTIVTAAILLVASPDQSSAAVRHVKRDAAGANDGTSWGVGF